MNKAFSREIGELENDWRVCFNGILDGQNFAAVCPIITGSHGKAPFFNTHATYSNIWSS